MRIVLAFFITVLELSAQGQTPDTTSALIPPAANLPKRNLNTTAPKRCGIGSTISYLVPSAFILYGVVSLRTDALEDVNETVKKEVYTNRTPHPTKLDNYLQYAPAAAVYALNIAGVHGKNNFRDRTFIYAMANIISGVTVTATKHITHETRPDGSDRLSFPSGHTATAFAAAEFLREEYNEVSPLIGIAGYADATATGYLRISNNKHWLGDVVAGAGVGILSTKLAYWLYPPIQQRLFKKKDPGTVLFPAFENGAWGLGIVHAF